MSGPIDGATRFRVSPSVYARPFGAELVLLEFARGEYFGLDDIGAEVWRHLERGASLSEIADSLVERYEVTRDIAFDDIVGLVTHMQDQALIARMD